MNDERLMIKNFSVNVKRLRYQYHLSQEEFGKRIGKSRLWVSKVERNECKIIDYFTVSNIVEIFDIDYDNLFKIEEERKTIDFNC